MRRIGLIVAIACVVTMAAPPVWASDLCIESIIVGVLRREAVAGVLVAKSFTIPGKNKCGPIHGFLSGALVVGTACTTPDGALLRIHFTTHLSNSDDAALVACTFGRPSLTGTCRLKAFFGGNSVDYTDPAAVASKCTGETVD